MDSSHNDGFSAGQKLSRGGLGCIDSWAHQWKGDQVTADEDMENVSKQAVVY